MAERRDADVEEGVLARYERTVDDVHRYATRLTGRDLAWAAALVEEAYVRLLDRSATGDADGLDTPWLTATVRRRFLDQRGDGRRQRGTDLVDGDPGPAGRSTEAFERVAIDQRTVLVLALVDGLTREEIAEQLGATAAAVDDLAARGRTALRGWLEEGPLDVIDDDALAEHVRVAGRRPSLATRRDIRSALLGDVVLEPTDRPGPAAAVRRHRVRGGALTGLATVAATVAIVTVVADGDDDAGGAAVPATTTVAPAEPSGLSLGELAGQRWIVERVEGHPWEGAIVPFVEFTDAPVFVRTAVGCENQSTQGRVEDGRVVVTSITFTVCDGSAPYSFSDPRWLPSQSGQRLRRAPLGRLELVDPTGRVIATYRSDRQLSTPNVADLVGTFALIAEGEDVAAAPTLHFGPDGSARLGACPASFLLGSWLRVYGIEDTAPCNPADDDDLAATLGLLVSGTAPFARAYLEADDDLLLAGRDVTVRLTRVPWGASDAAIAPADLSLYGLVARRQIAPEAVIAALEPHLGPPTADTGWVGASTAARGDAGRGCLSGQSVREIWWGDVRIDFWLPLGREAAELRSWSVGDPRVSGRDGRPGPPTLAATPDGVGVGSPASRLAGAFAATPLFELAAEALPDGTALSQAAVDGSGDAFLRVAVRGGVVTGIGVVSLVC